MKDYRISMWQDDENPELAYIELMCENTGEIINFCRAKKENSAIRSAVSFMLDEWLPSTEQL